MPSYPPRPKLLSLPSNDARESPVPLEPLLVGPLVEETKVQPLFTGHVR